MPFIFRKFLWSLPTACLIICILFCFTPFRHRRFVAKCISTTFAHELGIIVFLIYLSALLTITINIDHFWVSLLHWWPLPKINLFSGITELFSYPGIEMTVQNIFLFVPLGLIIPLLWTHKKLWEIMLIGFVTSLSIEIIQKIIGRIFSLTDLLLNIIGVLIGWTLWRFLFYYFPKLLSHFYCQEDMGADRETV